MLYSILSCMKNGPQTKKKMETMRMFFSEMDLKCVCGTLVTCRIHTAPIHAFHK